MIPVTSDQKCEALSLTQALRLSGFQVDTDYMNRNMKGNFKASTRFLANYVILIGEEEIKSNILTVKDNHSKEEFKVALADIVSFLDHMSAEDETCGCDCDDDTCHGHCH